MDKKPKYFVSAGPDAISAKVSDSTELCKWLLSFDFQ
jgi:hypothetical protein